MSKNKIKPVVIIKFTQNIDFEIADAYINEIQRVLQDDYYVVPQIFGAKIKCVNTDAKVINIEGTVYSYDQVKEALANFQKGVKSE